MKRAKNISIILFTIYIVLVLFLCLFNFSDTDIELPKSFLGIPADKIVHFIMFLPFTVSLGLVFCYIKPVNKFRITVLPFVLGLCFAAITEFLQNSITTSRSGDAYDFLADGLGLFAGALIIGILHKQIMKIFEFVFRVKLAE